MAQQNKKPQAEQDVNALLKVRHEKLANLQEAGRDPFQITKYDVTIRRRKSIYSNSTFICNTKNKPSTILYTRRNRSSTR